MASIVYFNGGQRIGFPLSDGQAWDAKYTLDRNILVYAKGIQRYESTVFEYTAEMYSRDVQVFCVTDDQDRLNPAKWHKDNTMQLSIIQDDGSLSPPQGTIIPFGPNEKYGGIAFDTIHIGKMCVVKLNRANTWGCVLSLGTIEEPPD